VKSELEKIREQLQNVE